MELALELVFWLCAFILVYVYFLYPLLMFILSKRERKSNLDSPKESEFPSVTIVIPSHNEESVISQKLDNHLQLDYPKALLNIVVLNDSSMDETGKIANGYVSRFPNIVKCFDVTDGKGKTNAVNKVMKTIDSDITVFSDANVFFEQACLRYLANSFENQKVGGVAGQLNYVNGDDSNTSYSNSLYWRYEEVIKRGESAFGSLMGADGSIFAIRTNLFVQLPEFVLDDFSTSMMVVAQGYEFKFNQYAKAFEKAATTTVGEFVRKVRISNRSYNTYSHFRGLFISKLRMMELVKLYSHKVLRWHSFSLMLLNFLTCTILAFAYQIKLYWFICVLEAVFFLIAAAGIVLPESQKFSAKKYLAIPAFFVSTNLAAFVGVAMSLAGKKIVVWKKAEGTR